MLCDTKAKCTFRRSKTFFAAQGLRASNLDHNNAYNSITVHWFAGNRAPCKWFSIGFILGLLWAVGLYDCQQKTVWHKRALCKTACAVFSTPWNILMTLSARRAGSSHRDPTLETVGTDLNNPHFSRSPGGFHAHLLTAGVRSCCPFSTSLTLTETHTHTHTILHYTHTRTLSQVVKYDTRSPVRRDKSIQTAGACWILEHIHTHRQQRVCWYSLHPSRGVRAELQVCSLSVFRLRRFMHVLPSSRAHFLSACRLSTNNLRFKRRPPLSPALTISLSCTVILSLSLRQPQ